MEIISSKDSNSGTNSIAFFDLDQTIIGENSARTLIQASYKKGFMTRADLLKGYYLSLLFKLKLRDTAIIIESLSKWLKGVPVDDLQKLTAEIFNNELINYIHKEVSAEISYHKKNGRKVVILSSSIYPICRLFADHLAMDDIVCSILEAHDGIYTGRSVGPFCFGKEKAVRLKEYCIENNINPLNAWYYGDAITDIFVLSSVGNPVCVNPDKKLHQAAFQRGWKILNWSV